MCENVVLVDLLVWIVVMFVEKVIWFRVILVLWWWKCLVVMIVCMVLSSLVVLVRLIFCNSIVNFLLL